MNVAEFFIATSSGRPMMWRVVCEEGSTARFQRRGRSVLGPWKEAMMRLTVDDDVALGQKLVQLAVQLEVLLRKAAVCTARVCQPQAPPEKQDRYLPGSPVPGVQ